MIVKDACTFCKQLNRRQVREMLEAIYKKVNCCGTELLAPEDGKRGENMKLRSA